MREALWKRVKPLVPGPVFRAGRRAFRRRQLARARRHGICDHVPATPHARPRILFYHLHGLTYGGTEKFLQILAKHLDKTRYDVHYLYSARRGAPRRDYLHGTGVDLIECEYEREQDRQPHYVQGMRPHLFDVVRDLDVDLVVTAGSGYATYPVANLTRLPVLHINVFGWVNPQRNLTQVCISQELARIFQEELPDRRVHVLPILSEGPDAGARDRGRVLRRRLGIPDDALVFGRIGRPSDPVWDPIGLQAFARIAPRHPHAHYLIMAPPPAAEAFVREHDVPRVHFLPPSGEEEDVWTFHGATDVLAHWRSDGETFGLNIAEALLMGNPVVTHRSHTWNAHLEYLDPAYSSVAPPDDVDAYAAALERFAAAPQDVPRMGEAARRRAEPAFLIGRNLDRVHALVEEALATRKAPLT